MYRGLSGVLCRYFDALADKGLIKFKHQKS